jgi:hypothetical protein
MSLKIHATVVRGETRAKNIKDANLFRGFRGILGIHIRHIMIRM